MNDVRGWIEKKLREQGYSSTRLPSFQLEIARTACPNARVLCVGLEDGETFDADNVDASIEKVSGTGFVVVVPTRMRTPPTSGPRSAASAWRASASYSTR